MDRGPLVKEEIDAGEELARGFDQYKPVKVAFWLKKIDEEQRYLYLASDQIDDTNFDIAYGEVLRLTQQIRSPYIDPFRINVIGGDDPMAIEAAETIHRFPSEAGRRLGGSRFAGLFADDLYIYPSPLPART